MKDPKETAAAVLARQTENLRKAAQSGVLNESFFGRYVADALAAGDELSRAGLRAWLVTQQRDNAMRPMVDAALAALDASKRASSSST